jgi:hypothetical protein
MQRLWVQQQLFRGYNVDNRFDRDNRNHGHDR